MIGSRTASQSLLISAVLPSVQLNNQSRFINFDNLRQGRFDRYIVKYNERHLADSEPQQFIHAEIIRDDFAYVC